VSVGGQTLVKGSVVTGSFDLMTKEKFKNLYPSEPVPKEAAVLSIVDNSGDTSSVTVKNANDIITGGALGGLIHSGTDYGDGVINAGVIQDNLNKLASSLADIFNSLNTSSKAYSINPNDTTKLQHQSGEDLNNLIFTGADGTTTTGINAGNIRVSEDLLKDGGIWDICCAYFDDPANYDEDAVGNSQNVVNMLGTRNQKQAALDGMSVEDFYSSMLGKIASAGDSARTMYDTQCDVVDSIENQLDSAYGVDLNEELIDLVKYQTAYAAAARVFSTVNSCLDTLVNLGR
jgi:flagellar hook-associated protein FlgK